MPPPHVGIVAAMSDPVVRIVAIVLGIVAIIAIVIWILNAT